MQDKIVINDYIENDPLSEENLDKTLKTVNRFHLLYPNKSIWIYSGYTWESIINHISCVTDDFDYIEESCIDGLYEKRKQIISQCDVMVDGRYIGSQRDITLKWRGSSNQRVIDIKQSLQQNKIILYCDQNRRRM